MILKGQDMYPALSLLEKSHSLLTAKKTVEDKAVGDEVIRTYIKELRKILPEYSQQARNEKKNSSQ